MLIPIDEVSIDMTPRLPVHDGPYGCASDSERSAYSALAVRRPEFTDAPHLADCHFGAVALFSERLSAFFNHVADVVLLRSEKQVFWVHTRRVVAAMADRHVGGYWSIVNYPRQTRGSYWHTAFEPSGDPQPSATMPIESPCPYPTIRRFLDPTPETNFRWDTRSIWCRVVTLVRTKTATRGGWFSACFAVCHASKYTRNYIVSKC